MRCSITAKHMNGTLGKDFLFLYKSGSVCVVISNFFLIPSAVGSGNENAYQLL